MAWIGRGGKGGVCFEGEGDVRCSTRGDWRGGREDQETIVDDCVLLTCTYPFFSCTICFIVSDLIGNLEESGAGKENRSTSSAGRACATTGLDYNGN